MDINASGGIFLCFCREESRVETLVNSWFLFIDIVRFLMQDMHLQKIEELKQSGDYDGALSLANRLLAQNPRNREVLFQVADLQFRKWEISKAEKPINFLLEKELDNDAMSYYVKGVLEMEKTNWAEAKDYFRRALHMLEQDNAEVLRCYGLCEYWSGNREEGILHLKKAYHLNEFDAEIILNLTEVLILEKKFVLASKYIKQYRDQKEKLQFFEREVIYYEEKMRIFEDFIRNHEE